MCKTSTGVKRPISSPLVNLFLLDNASPYVRPEASQQPAYQTPTSPAVSQVSAAPSAALSLDAPAFYNMTPSSMPSAMPLMMSSSSSSSSSSSYSEATPSVNHQLNLSEEKQAPSGIPACINCRRSKVRCEGGIPCRRCLRLGMDVSCARCEPQKRGRKRKQPSDGTIKLEGEAKAPVVKRPRVRAPAAAPGATATNKPSAAAAHAAASFNTNGAAVVPTVATPADQVEQEAVERFSLLTRQFRSWRDQAFTKPEDKAGLTRFLMFCSDISHLMHEYSQQLQHVADKNKLVSFWLCSNLADDVNRVVTTLGPVAVLPKMNSDASMETGVEKQVYKRMPFGVMMLPLQPRPFAGDSKPWTNSLVTELLGYSKDECQTILAQRTEFNRLLQNSTTMMCAFWEAVMAQKPSYTCRSLWTHKSGATVATVTTCWIKYARGLPAWQCLYLQQDPAYAPVLPTRVPLAAAAPVAAPVVAAPAPAPVVMVKSAPSSADDSLLLAKHASSSLMARPSFSSVFDDVMVLSPSGTPSDDATSSWDESTDKWLGNTSFDDIELML